MPSIFDQMINSETGEIDEVVLAEAIEVRAVNEYRAPNFPPRYRREAEVWCRERAAAMRRCWHRDRGLPVPGEENSVLVQVPDWGASGDSFRRGR